MREIKFRAWDTRENDWLCVKHLGIMNNGVWYVQAIDENENDIDPPHFNDDESVKLMQYTGLKDKNGVEIYEGDILTSKEYPYQDEGVYNYHGVVEYAEELGCFVAVKRLVNPKKRGISDGMSEYMYDVEFSEVIGNIHEHPHLLETKK